MTREQTNPNIRRVERERARYASNDEADETGDYYDSSASRPHPVNEHSERLIRPLPHRTPSGVAGESLVRPASLAGLVAVHEGSSGEAALSSSGSDQNTSDPVTERRPKRPRRAPSPSRWVPASLQNFSLSPTISRVSAPLPPVRPSYDAASGIYEERDSFAGVPDENIDPSGESAEARAERLRNFEFAPYHPCGWIGRLPGPAVVTDVTNFTKGSWKQSSSGGGGGSAGGRRGGGVDNASYVMEFNLSASN